MVTESCPFFSPEFSIPDEGGGDLPVTDTLSKTVLSNKLLQPLFFFVSYLGLVIRNIT